MRPLAALALCLAVAASACGPKGPPCAVPVTGAAAMDLLDGTWTVQAFDGTIDGEITFDGADLSTRWEDVTLVGSWEHLASADNAHTVRLRIDEAWEGEVRTRYGRFDQIDVELVFGNRDLLYALQPDGAWTLWRRVPPPVEE